MRAHFSGGVQHFAQTPTNPGSGGDGIARASTASTMSSPGTCVECVRLWSRFAAATRAHVELLKKGDRIDSHQVEDAATQRDAARLAVYRHLVTGHVEESRTAAG
jgi:hypothetical protein